MLQPPNNFCFTLVFGKKLFNPLDKCNNSRLSFEKTTTTQQICDTFEKYANVRMRTKTRHNDDSLEPQSLDSNGAIKAEDFMLFQGKRGCHQVEQGQYACSPYNVSLNWWVRTRPKDQRFWPIFHTKRGPCQILGIRGLVILFHGSQAPSTNTCATPDTDAVHHCSFQTLDF